MDFPDGATFGRKVVDVDMAYAAAHVSRGTTPAQVCNYLQVCGLPRNPALPFCSAGGSYGVLHAYCDLQGISYDESDVISVFRGQIAEVEAHWLLITASCEDLREWAVAHGRFISIDQLSDDFHFLPGMVILSNFETEDKSIAHHYSTVRYDPADVGEDPDEIPCVDYNTSDNSQGNGGCVALKRRVLGNPNTVGIVVPIGLPMGAG